MNNQTDFDSMYIDQNQFNFDMQIVFFWVLQEKEQELILHGLMILQSFILNLTPTSSLK